MVEFREVSSEGVGSRLGGAIKGVVVGGALFLAAFPMLWMNEGCAVDQYEKIGAVEKVVVEVPADNVIGDNEGKVVHVSSEAISDEVLDDPSFDVHQKGIKLRRDVEMFQVVEHVETEERKKVGGGVEKIKTYRYETQWRSRPVDSSSFNQKYFLNSGYPHNPKKFPIEGKLLKANKVALGAFTLSPGLIDSYTKFSPVDVAASKPKLRNVKKTDGGFFMGASPANPVIGDVRVKFQAALNGPASVIAQQAGASFVPFVTPQGKVEWLTEKNASAAEMIQDQRDAVAILTWILRAAGFLMMFIGLVMIFKPLSVMGDVIPFIGTAIGYASGLVAFIVAASLSCAVIAIAWFAHRPLVAIPLLMVVVGGIVGIFLLRRGKKNA